MAARAGGSGHELHHVLAIALGFGVFEVGAEIAEDAVEASAGAFAFGWTVEEEVLLLGGELVEGLADIDFVFFSCELDEPKEILRGRARTHCAVEKRFGPVGDCLGWIEVVDGAEAVALGAGAVGRVEGEAAGLELGNVDAAVRASHGGGVEGVFLLAGFRVLDADEDEAVGHLEGLGDGGFEAAGIVLRRCTCKGGTGVFRGQRLEDNTVDDGLNGVVLPLFEAHALGDLNHFAVDPGTEALLIEGLEFFAELAFAASDDGGVDGDSFTGGEGHDALDDLIGGLAGDGAAAVGAMGLAYRGVEEAKIVVDLGDGADCGARGAGGGFLLDGDGGGEAVD